MEQALLKRDRYHHIKTKTGRILRVVREHYLRNSIDCSSDICTSGCSRGSSSLPSDVTHYLFPDGGICKDFIEVLELDDFKGITFTQTSVNNVLTPGGRATVKRLTQKVRDSRNGCIYFANEFFGETFCERSSGDNLEVWQTKLVYKAAVWYYYHLNCQKDIVMLTDNKDLIDELVNETPGVHVMSLSQYLSLFWPNLTEAKDMFESLAASLLLSKQKGGNKQYDNHFPPEVLQMHVKSSDQYFEGILNVNKHHAQKEAFIHGFGQKELKLDSDILVSGITDRNRAIHGDRVVVQLLPKSRWKGRISSLTQDNENEDDCEEKECLPTARVVGIIQRNWRDYVATLPKEERHNVQSGKAEAVLVIPFDYRIPKIRITTSQVSSLQGQRIMVRIDSWEANSQYPNGHLVRKLGPVGDLETEIATVMVEHHLSAAGFSELQQLELPTNSKENPWKPTKQEISKRLDLRHLLIFSIDPKGCEDVDDTLSIRELPNGELELGVHIADVSHFVHPHSLTDLEARQRSTTVYLADRRYDMLPAILSADLCSLVSGVDRYAVSVIWHLDSHSYQVNDVWYGRTIIKSAHKMFYEAAQALHDGKDVRTDIPELKNMDPSAVEKRLQKLKWSVDKLMDVARHLKANRVKEGAVQLEGLEVKVELNEEQEIENLIPKQTMEIHETIAECMIFANHWVAKRIVETYPQCSLLRYHPLPRQDHFQQLVESAKAKGFEVDTSTSKTLADSLDKCVDANDVNVNGMLRSLATKAMSNALYFSTGSLPRDQFFHYGLALDCYTHFTSPIRRYADVIVHRLLIAAGNNDSNSVLNNKDLQELCEHINNKHRASQHAQKDSQELFQTIFFKDKNAEVDECCTVDAIIESIRSNGFLIFVPRYGMKGAVFLKDKNGLVRDATGQTKPVWVAGSLSRSGYSVTVNTLTGSTTYNLFDHVTVRITVQLSDCHSHSIKYELVSNKPHEEMQTEQGNTTVSKDALEGVVSAVREMHIDAGDSHGVDVSVVKDNQFSQSNSKMYQLLNYFRTMALQECS
ncbi:DIS3-like exonuclease 1 [Anneissia japonica]|uniref:DIS3-like exonuclease 1 n=1 Tax=Anneissia japonica TaxID=1529436 RepID=UPI0014259762|nr:DIS3-like exonuclease 1 [Anneissia japonica]